jgi:hypothetical protein
VHGPPRIPSRSVLRPRRDHAVAVKPPPPPLRPRAYVYRNGSLRFAKHCATIIPIFCGQLGNLYGQLFKIGYDCLGCRKCRLAFPLTRFLHGHLEVVR